jgi:hypothetical protein
MRSILTEIYLCLACSYHEKEDQNARAGGAASAPEKARIVEECLKEGHCVFAEARKGGAAFVAALEDVTSKHRDLVCHTTSQAKPAS